MGAGLGRHPDRAGAPESPRARDRGPRSPRRRWRRMAGGYLAGGLRTPVQLLVNTTRIRLQEITANQSGAERTASDLGRPARRPRGGSFVLLPRSGWRDLAGRCWHARPQPRAPPTNPAPEPSPLGRLDSMAGFVGSVACPWAPLACQAIHRSPVPRAGQTARPGIRQEGSTHGRDEHLPRRHPPRLDE
jgi:hypothetical protein